MESLIQEKLRSVRPGLKRSVTKQLRAFWGLRETGMRGNEVRCLRLENINLKDGLIHLRDDPNTDFRIKGRREESIHVSDRLSLFWKMT